MSDDSETLSALVAVVERSPRPRDLYCGLCGCPVVLDGPDPDGRYLCVGCDHRSDSLAWLRPPSPTSKAE